MYTHKDGFCKKITLQTDNRGEGKNLQIVNTYLNI